MSRLSIFGVTGSIGASAIRLWQDDPQSFQIDTLSAQSNLDELISLARLTRAAHVVIGDETLYLRLRDELPGVSIAAGSKAIEEAARREVDICLNAVIGAAGLPISFACLGRAKRLALANKESLVCAGGLLMREARGAATEIIPVDSEHSAIFQCLLGESKDQVSRILLTASGGPFRTWSHAAMQSVKLEDALKHPNWNMGARITIDSASMFNKALEMIETYEFFEISYEKIEVLVHPQSIIHSLVEFIDHGLVAQLGVPDMRHAIAYALHYPDRKPSGVEALDLVKLGHLDFEAPDLSKFKALRLARDVMAIGGTAGAALNAAKEIALDGFIGGKIPFLAMADLVEEVVSNGDWKIRPGNLSDVLEADARARVEAHHYLNKKTNLL